MTWRETIAKAGAYLQAKAVPDPQVAAELLAARLLKTGRGTLAAHLEKDVPEKWLEAMRRGMARLANGEPVQYVIGEWDFRHLTLKCDRRALIPRPETEELVTRVLAHLNRSPFPVPRSPFPVPHSPFPVPHSPVIVDVGTGTGAIVLSLAQEFKGDAAFLGTDVSEDAIALAQENAAKCGLADRVKFAVADGLDDFDEPECVDVIVSNPPYIESAVCDTLDPRVRDYEPRLALDGGVSGLDFYDRYLGDALNILKPGGAVFFEIGEGQGAALAKLMADYGFGEVKIEKDFAGHDRYASGVIS
ncbi:MAG: peptide chain release factor N(5)-glutamine methyltransferase [Kiritimatiellae bacterium]|nr:peptide chain release factor N(5)-glutamine methyltransferase [Kiritimatiellia bacterium]